MKKNLIIISLVFISSFAIFGWIDERTKDSEEELEEIIIILTCSDTLSPENLAFEIVRARLKHPEIVFKQAMLETGNLDCVHCSMDRNNLFGFRDDKGYLDFITWQSSVYYYSRWQKKYKKGDYYTFLEKIGYAEDSLYVQRLKSVPIPENIKTIFMGVSKKGTSLSGGTKSSPR